MDTPPKRILLDISWEALLKVLALGVGIWLAYVLRDIIFMLFVVFIMVATFNPTINRWQNRMPRAWAVSLFYACIALVVGLLSYLLIPQLSHQINELIKALPTIESTARPYVARLQNGATSQLFDQAVNSLTNWLNRISTDLVDTTVSFVGSLAIVATGIVLSFYLLLEEENASIFFNQVLPQHRFEAVYSTVRKISERMGNWVRGQFLLMLIIGASQLLLYLVIGLHSPLPLAIWSGVCEVIPYVGPALGILPALIVAMTTGSVLQAVLVVALSFVLVQQLEAHIIVPKVMGRAVGLSPALVILALLIGGKLFGLVGALVAIPTAAIISVVVGEWHELRKIWE